MKGKKKSVNSHQTAPEQQQASYQRHHRRKRSQPANIRSSKISSHRLQVQAILKEEEKKIVFSLSTSEFLTIISPSYSYYPGSFPARPFAQVPQTYLAGFWSIQTFILPASRPALGISEIFRFTHEIYLVSSLHRGGHFQQEQQQKTEDMTNLESGCL